MTPLPSRLRESAKVMRALQGVVTVSDRIARELEEAAQALEAGPWMPIETAPKDKALLTHDGVSYNLAHFNTALGKWIANHPYDERLPREPIRWTLLPPHPRSGTAAQVAQEGGDVADCVHMNFAASVGVGRLTQTEGGPVTGYVAEIRVNCADCGKRFQFLGLEPGYDNQGARVSLDGLEANIALAPEGEKPNPFQRMAYNVGSFDG